MSFRKFFLNEPDKTHVQLFRYAIVGVIAFLVDVTGLYLLTEYASLHYLISATISFIFAMVVNYILSVKWAFDENVVENKFFEFLLFLIIGLVGLGINNYLMYLMTSIYGLFYILSKLIASIIVFIWNFIGRKYVLFTLVKKAEKEPIL